MYIRNGMRFDATIPHVIDDVQYPVQQFCDSEVLDRLDIIWQKEPAPPADYSPETHTRREIIESPFVVYERKSDEQIAAVMADRARAQAAVCDPWQLRKALTATGLRQAVEDAVAASTDQSLKDGWEFAPRFRSDDPFMLAMGAALGKSESEIRDLIALAATL